MTGIGNKVLQALLKENRITKDVVIRTYYQLRKRRYLKIQDCFEFQCPERWSNLEKTDRKVHKAANMDQLLKFLWDGKCVAYFESEMGV